MGERHTIKESMSLWEKALALDPSNDSYKQSYQRVRLIWEGDFAS